MRMVTRIELPQGALETHASRLQPPQFAPSPSSSLPSTSSPSPEDLGRLLPAGERVTRARGVRREEEGDTTRTGQACPLVAKA